MLPRISAHVGPVGFGPDSRRKAGVREGGPFPTFMLVYGVDRLTVDDDLFVGGYAGFRATTAR